MNQRDLKNFIYWDEIWNEEVEDDLGFFYSEDMSEDIKNK